MKKILLILSLLTLLQSIAIAEPTPCDDARLAIQSAIVSGGNLSIGFARYTSTSELGVTIAGIYNTSNMGSRLVTPAIFAGFRHSLGEYSWFAYGLDVASKFGTQSGQKVDADIFVGPYISLEQQLSTHLLLVGWVNPYAYEYEKLNGMSASIHRFFISGGIGLTFMF